MRFPLGYEGEITVEKDYLVNLQENSDNTPQSFKIAIYTDQTQDYILDELTDGMEPQLECQFPCKSCSTTDRSQCLSCYTESEFPFL